MLEQHRGNVYPKSEHLFQELEMAKLAGKILTEGINVAQNQRIAINGGLLRLKQNGHTVFHHWLKVIPGLIRLDCVDSENAAT
ncbi:hypothetical protein D3C72_2219500 [compost metagenome]